MSTHNTLLPPRRLLWTCLPLIATLAACSGDTEPLTGGGAGDGEEDLRVAANIATLTPFEGTYDLTGGWSGTPGDVAYLLIRAPADDGVSEVVLRDIEETENCSERARFGTLFVDDAGGNRDIFLDELFDFDSAVATLLADGQLQLSFTDTNDIDGDGDRNNRVSYLAGPVALTEQDLPQACFQN